MATIWEKAISILAGNLNSGRSYLITAVPCHLEIEAEVWGKLEQEIDTESWATSKDFRVVIFSLLGHIHSDDLVVMLELA